MAAGLLAFFIALFASVMLVVPVRALALRVGMVDLPGPRKVHLQPIPLLGGVSMYAAVVIAVRALAGEQTARWAAPFVAVAPTAGISVAHEESYGPRDSDMTPQLTNIKGTPGLKAVVNPGFGQGPAIVTRNYRQLGVAVPLYQSHGVASKQFIDLAGPAAEGVRLPAAALLVADKLDPADPQKPIVVNYARRYQEKTGQPVSTFGGHAYDGLMILVQAMQRAGGFDKAKVRDEIEKTKGYIGTGGIVNMTPADHMGLDLTAFRMLEIRNGDWTLMADTGS